MKDPFYTMDGEEVLTRIRDHLLAIATRQKMWAESSAAVSGGENPEVELGIKMVEAAASVLLHVIATGQEFKVKHEMPPIWILKIADQARCHLIDWPKLEAAGVTTEAEFRKRKHIRKGR